MKFNKTLKRGVALILVLFLFFIAGFYVYKHLIRPGQMKSNHFESQYYEDCVVTNLSQDFSKGCTILVGNSLLVDFPLESITSHGPIFSYAIRGTYSDEAIKRVSLLEKEPAMIVYMLGINDLLSGFRHQAVLENVSQYADKVLENGNIELLCMGLLPVSFEDGEFVKCDQINEEILLYNEGLSKLAEAKGFSFFSMHSRFVDEKGTLKSELTYDGVHLSPEGYQIWTELLPALLSDEN